MSREKAELVRRHLARYEGQDFAPVVRELVDRLGPAPEPGAILSVLAEDPCFRHLHPEVVWEIATGSPLDGKATGPTEIVRMWAEWIEVWESYVYRVVEYRDLGEWVLTSIDLRARGRGGIPVEGHTFEIRSVRDGKIAVIRFFGSEAEALEAAGLRE
jgi:ketosteroid isomerase-like protein